jgi:serine phosphatase RsbU (regulator of sigma subunit)
MGTMSVEWAVAAKTLEGELASGDVYVAKTFDGGALIAVIDGLGHGLGAAGVSQLAVAVLEEEPSADVASQFRRCHERLRRTRGVVMSVARFDARRGELTWSGVGNVEAVLLRADVTATPRRHTLNIAGGVVGGTLGAIRPATLSVTHGDVLILATDGVRPRFPDEIDLFAGASALAMDTLERFRRGTDDALVLVARFGGRAEHGG